MKHLIIGFSAAGANAAEAIRRHDPDGEITVITADERQFYLRLDLDGIFHGKSAADLSPRSSEYWREKRIAIIADIVTAVEPDQHRICTASGNKPIYDRLLIAVGSAPRKLNVPGEDLNGVVSYHTLTDAERIHALRGTAKTIVIIGGGILGLELAHAARNYGWNTTVLVRGGHVGSPIVDASGSSLVAESLERNAVNVIYHDEVAAFEGDHGTLTRVKTRQGRTLETDLAAICVGVSPSIAFLNDSGLLTDGRLIVDERMQTRAEDVYAAGDAVSVQMGERLIPCNTWNVASAQARVAAANLCGKSEVWKEDVLYNLDHLFDQEFAMIGLWDERHNPGRIIHELRSTDFYRALVTHNGILESALLLGSRWGDKRVRKLIAQKARVEGRIERVFAEDAKPEEFL